MLHLCCILSTIFVFSAAAPGDLVQIKTANGIVEGVESLTIDNQKTFYAFRGMRYGEAPVGNLRFRPPVPAGNWSGVYNATEHRNQCVQSVDLSNVVIGAEDCLFINVYTTQLPNNTSKGPLPVLVWIHGGGFIYFSGNLDLHGADRFLDHDVLVVSFNYRLGIFGFMSTEDNIVPGNYGLKDQVLALQWVQKNIANFGGDPTQVTIFGESAGAASVHYLRQAKCARGLFTGVIANSGNTLNPWSISRKARDMAFRVGIGNGIVAFDSKTLVERLRKVDAERLQKSSYIPTALDLIDILNGLPYAPILEEESAEAIYTENSFVTQEDGNINLGPLLLGFNSLEGRDLAALPWYQRFLLLEQYNLFPSRITPRDMNATDNGRRTVGQNIRSFYFQNGSILMGQNFAHFFSDNEFVRGTVKSSQLQSRYSNVYLYRFSFTGNTSVEGVNHGEELQYLFEAPGNVQHTAAANLTVKRMVEMWTNFAKTGNPTSTRSEAVSVDWPLVNATGGDAVHYLDIGDELVSLVNPSDKQMKFWYKQYSDFGNPPYNTY